MTIKFENIYECEKTSSNLKKIMKKYEYETIYEYEKISSNLLFEFFWDFSLHLIIF